MNARQKAKYYKRRYEELLETPLPKFTVTNYKIDTIEFQRIYPGAMITEGCEEILTAIITRDLVREMATVIDKYVTISTMYEPHRNWYKVTGEVKVVGK